ncbi:17R [Xanthomonas phage Xp10]|uniref:17R n=1 Tax=Xanthomonas phage Xp10 TaxID=2907956 RepID=Q7Y5K0_9CAUD|nr:HNH endonuclease [Xanthomonas phage Xp10]AAP58684.1 17R [Xanthomonas phage Xp10]
MVAKDDLTFEEASKLLAYDPDTGELRWKVANNNRVKVGSVAGSVDTATGYIRVMLHGKLYQAHRLAWLLHHGSWPNNHLDHINGQKDDNRIENLRECSNAENCQNRGKRSDNSSGVTGVCWHKRDKKWQALIMVNGNKIHLGYFDTIDEAATARAAAKAQYHKFQPFDRENN